MQRLTLHVSLASCVCVHCVDAIQELNQTEFESLQWSELEAIVGADIMKQRFKDAEGGITMHDVWLKLDIDTNSTITVIMICCNVIRHCPWHCANALLSDRLIRTAFNA